MSLGRAVSSKEVPILRVVPKRCSCKSVPSCSCLPSFPNYRSGMPAWIIFKLLLDIKAQLHLTNQRNIFKSRLMSYFITKSIAQKLI